MLCRRQIQELNMPQVQGSNIWFERQLLTSAAAAVDVQTGVSVLTCQSPYSMTQQRAIIGTEVLTLLVYESYVSSAQS